MLKQAYYASFKTWNIFLEYTLNNSSQSFQKSHNYILITYPHGVFPKNQFVAC